MDPNHSSVNTPAVRFLPSWHELRRMAGAVSLRALKYPTLKTPRGEFRLMANGEVDFNGMNISRYGLAPLKKCAKDGQWHDMPVRRAACH
jgi:hypothetical protein